MFEINETEKWHLQEGVWIEYRIPSAADAAAYVHGMRRIKRDLELPDNDATQVFEHKEAIDHMVNFAAAHIISVKGFTVGGKEIQWSDRWFEQHNTNPRNILTNLGHTAFQKLNNLIILVSEMRMGMREDTKKKQSDTSEPE